MSWNIHNIVKVKLLKIVVNLCCKNKAIFIYFKFLFCIFSSAFVSF